MRFNAAFVAIALLTHINQALATNGHPNCYHAVEKLEPSTDLGPARQFEKIFDATKPDLDFAEFISKVTTGEPPKLSSLCLRVDLSWTIPDSRTVSSQEGM